MHPQLYGSRSLMHFGCETDSSMPFAKDFALLNMITSNRRAIYRLLSPWFGNVLVVTLGSVFVDGFGKLVNLVLLSPRHYTNEYTLLLSPHKLHYTHGQTVFPLH